jgi:hypothetical protein
MLNGDYLAWQAAQSSAITNRPAVRRHEEFPE